MIVFFDLSEMGAFAKIVFLNWIYPGRPKAIQGIKQL